MNDWLSSHEVVARVPGLTFRMLDQWVRQGRVHPAVAAHGSGSRRRFRQSTVHDLTRLMAAHDFLGGCDRRGYEFDTLVRVADLLDEVVELRRQAVA